VFTEGRGTTLISEFTWRQVKDEFPQTREIDVTAVRGRNEPVRLYELMLAEGLPASRLVAGIRTRL
jgi:class 3 adenylate cyclase